MSRKIVLINQSAGYLFIDIANAFIKSYDEVVLMAGDILPMNEPLNEKIRIQKIFSYNRSSTVKRILSWIISLLNIWWLLLFKYRRYDLFVSSNPPTASTMLPILFRRNISLLIYDIYPDGLVAGSFVSKNNIIFRCWAWLNRRAYKKVKKILVLTPGMAIAMKAYAPAEKITVVPAWASTPATAMGVAENENLFVKKYGLEGKFIVMYSGNLGKEYELESLVELAEELRHNNNIVFIIMGKGWKKNLLEGMIAGKKLNNCLLLPYQPAELFVHSLSAFHIGVVSLADAVAKVAIPSKTYNLLAAHRPIFCIGDETSDLAAFLTRNEIGITVKAGNMEKMKSFIDKLYTDKNYFNSLCGNAAGVAKNYTKERAKEIVEITG